MIATKKRPEKSGTYLTQEYYSINNPEDDKIHEPDPESSPEDMQTCPCCGSKELQRSTIGGIDPQDTIDIVECFCGWADKKLFSEMTYEEILMNLREVEF